MSFSCLADGVPAPWESNREAGTPRAAASFCQISYRNIIKHEPVLNEESKKPMLF